MKPVSLVKQALQAVVVSTNSKHGIRIKVRHKNQPNKSKVASTNSKHGIRIKVHHKNQPNKSKVALHKLLL